MQEVTNTKCLTNKELELLSVLMKAQSSGGIKDVRLIHNLRNKVIKSLSPAPKHVQPNEFFKDTKNPTQEEIDNYNKANGEFQKELEAYHKVEKELNLNSIEEGIIRTRIINFKGYYTDEASAELILTLADKFGVTE